jgi:hypothetical protein
MKRFSAVIMTVLILSSSLLFAQTKENDIPADQLPGEVATVLSTYIEILNSPNLDECALRFVSIAGGSLVNDDASALAQTIKDMSLKKDFNDIKYYKQPIEITRVNKTYSNGLGYGVAATKGYVYKIWIQKIDPSKGMPAPVSILMPDAGQYVKTPKVVNIGSF